MDTLTPDEKILQLLNRITFGPRPGDLERVRQMGTGKYLDQQLHPARLDDSAVESRVAALTTLSLSTEELAEDFREMRAERRMQMEEKGNRPGPSAPAGQQNQPHGPNQNDGPEAMSQAASPAPAREEQPGQNAADAPAPGAVTAPPGPSADLASFLDVLKDPGPKPVARGAPVSANSATAAAGVVGASGAGMPESGRDARAPVNARARAGEMPLPRRVIMELAQEELLRAVYSQRQLQEVMVQFWMNHFNIFAPKGADKWLITSFERDTIRPRALGKFEDLLVATAQSPAMLFYLDNWMSVAPEGAERLERPRPAFPPAPGPVSGLLGRARYGVWRPFGPPGRLAGQNPGAGGQGQGARAAAQRARRGLNENYGRELMELHTLGVNGGYTQKDVTEVARCLTGWTINRPQQGGEFIFRPALHDAGPKVVLGRSIPGGRGLEDGMEVLHLLAHHPSTARFISLKLARRFVSDDPPPALVERTAQTFLKKDGDLAAVLDSILIAPELYSAAAYRAKVKSPLELVASTIRALDASTDAGVPLLELIARMGQPMFQYQAPTGFPDRASTWINSGSLLARVNFATLLASNKIPGTEVHLSCCSGDVLTAASGAPTAVGGEEAGVGGEDSALRSRAGAAARIDDFAARLLHGDLSNRTRAAILKQMTGEDEVPGAQPAADPEIAALLIASPDFQRR